MIASLRKLKAAMLPRVFDKKKWIRNLQAYQHLNEVFCKIRYFKIHSKSLLHNPL